MFPAFADSKPHYHRCPENALCLFGLAWDTAQFPLVRSRLVPVIMVRGEVTPDLQVEESKERQGFPVTSELQREYREVWF